MSKEGNINDNGKIFSGRKNENKKAYEDNYDRIFGKKDKKENKEKGATIWGRFFTGNLNQLTYKGCASSAV